MLSRLLRENRLTEALPELLELLKPLNADFPFDSASLSVGELSAILETLIRLIEEREPPSQPPKQGDGNE